LPGRRLDLAGMVVVSAMLKFEIAGANGQFSLNLRPSTPDAAFPVQ
jgi:hypothetical protein